jgi:hypothetical protein
MGVRPDFKSKLSDPTNRTKVVFSTAARPPSHCVHQSVQHPLVEFCMRCRVMSAGLVAGQDQEKPPTPDLLYDPRHGLRRISLVVSGINREYRRLYFVQARRRVIVGAGGPLPKQIVSIRVYRCCQLRIYELVDLFSSGRQIVAGQRPAAVASPYKTSATFVSCGCVT